MLAVAAAARRNLRKLSKKVGALEAVEAQKEATKWRTRSEAGLRRWKSKRGARALVKEERKRGFERREERSLSLRLWVA